MAADNREVVHGGNIQQAAEQYGLNEGDILDFSANISFMGVPPGFETAVASGLKQAFQYPDRRYMRLRQRISNELNLKWQAVFPGNGSMELIGALLRNFGREGTLRVLIIGPTFAEYARCVRLAGGEILLWQTERDSWTLDLEALRPLLKTIDVAIICNPNNPTGVLQAQETLLEIATELDGHGGWLLIDEAFMDFVEDMREQSVSLTATAGSRNIVVFRSLTKFFAIPGLRLGYCVAPPQIINELRLELDPWSVNCVAEAVGCFLCSEQTRTFRRQVRQNTAAVRQALRQQLQNLAGLGVHPGAANFLLVGIKRWNMTSPALYRRLASHGILVRDCASFAEMGTGYIRIAVRDPNQNQVLVQRLEQLSKCR